MKLEHFLTPYAKINSKWIKDMKVSVDSVKFLEENIGSTLFDINHSKILSDPLSILMEIKINKWDLIKFKSFCTAKKTINKMRRQPSEWEEIIANEATDKELISRMYKQVIQLNIRKTTKKWTEDLNRHFSKENIQMANKHNKRFSTFLIIKEKQIKIAVKYDLTKIRMAIVKKSTNNKCYWGCGEKQSLLHCWWECKLIQPLWETVWRFLKN